MVDINYSYQNNYHLENQLYLSQIRNSNFMDGPSVYNSKEIHYNKNDWKLSNLTLSSQEELPKKHHLNKQQLAGERNLNTYEGLNNYTGFELFLS